VVLILNTQALKSYKCWWDVEESEPCAFLGRLQYSVAAMKTVWWFLKKAYNYYMSQQFNVWVYTLKN
jgi:hypothetical protein